MTTLAFTLNSKQTSVDVAPHEMLAQVLRDRLGFIGVKIGCGEGECGACTVLVDGKAVASCIYPALKVQGRRVDTIEGLAHENQLHAIQQAFVQKAAAQCGYCTPGMIMSAKALLDENPHPSRDEIEAAISGNLCRCTGYQQIIQAIQLASGGAPPAPRESASAGPLGRSVPRLDIRTKVAGTRKFPQDFNMPGQLFAAVAWSKHAHATLKSLDVSAAAAFPGVVRVLTAGDVPLNEYGINSPDQPVLVAVGGKVRWVGDRVALVVAGTEEAARQAAALVRDEYELLPVVTDAREAMKPESPVVPTNRADNVLYHAQIRRGDLDAAFASAAVIVEGDYETPFVEHAYMQPEAGIGYIDEQGRVTVNAASQWPQDDLHQMSHMLKLPEDRIREIVPAIGGAFGGREDMFIQHLLALCAFVLRRPVKMVFTREESITRTGKRHPFYFRMRWAADAAGRLLAVDVQGIADAGAYQSTSIPVLINAVSFFAGPYKVPAAKVDGYVVYTNNAITMAMRGFGATQPPFAHEQQMDRLAEKLGLDPVEIRMRNLLEEGDTFLTGNAMPAGVGLKPTLRAAALAAGWTEVSGRWVRPARQAASGKSRKRGVGVACALKNVGYSFGFDDQSTCSVTLRLDDRGGIISALLKTGATDVGMGVHTALCQIAAQALGIPYENVRFALVDTADVPDAGSCSASRHTYISGNATVRACQAALELRKEMLAAGKLEKQVTAQATYHGREQRATGPYDPETGACEPHIAYGYGCQIAEVEVDVETGQVVVQRLIAAHDVGAAVNPEMVVGQIVGGVHMGVGYALTEDYVQVAGLPKTRRFSEYSIPTVLDMPREIVPIIVEVPDPTGPFGAKGLGEVPTLPTAPAIANAVADATGARVTTLPLTAERVLAAMKPA
jgi:selenium-dependent xanthine dehydrogenase